MNKVKEKIPSQFSFWLSPNYYTNLNFINFAGVEKRRGRAENRTRNFWVTTKYFTTKLLAHNEHQNQLNYLNLVNNFIV